jgi:hypothetical protein
VLTFLTVESIELKVIDKLHVVEDIVNEHPLELVLWMHCWKIIQSEDKIKLSEGFKTVSV